MHSLKDHTRSSAEVTLHPPGVQAGGLCYRGECGIACSHLTGTEKREGQRSVALLSFFCSVWYFS